MQQDISPNEPIAFVGLAFDPVNMRLIGTTNVPTRAMYAIDTVTLRATLLHTFSPAFDFGGIDCDNLGNVYGVNDLITTVSGTPHRRVYKLSSSTPTLQFDLPDNEFDYDGLAVGNGKAYVVTDGPSNMQPAVQVFDLATGFPDSMSLSSPFTQPSTFSGASLADEMLDANTAWLSGTLELKDTGTFGEGVRKLMTYKVMQNNTLIYEGKFVATATLSNFSVPVPNGITGAARIIWDGGSFLLRRQDLVLTGGNLNVGNVSLRNGDVLDSGEISAADIDEINASFGAVWPSPLCQNADCDASGEVDAADVDIVTANFGLTNDDPGP